MILKNFRVLVLDQATSSLDNDSEAIIREAIRHVMADWTNIVIAHRLSTILSADLILVMDCGQIIEGGIHADLILKGGFYVRLYQTQFHSKE